MLRLSDRPPAPGTGPGLQIKRTPQGKPLVGFITSSSLLGTNTHFFNGRTVPCELPTCAACANQLPWRWHGYLAMIDQHNGQHCLFEMTAQAAEPLVAYYDAHGSIRGLVLEATRAGFRKNGRVYIRCSPTKQPAPALPPEPNLRYALCVLWHLPFTALEDDGLQKGAPRFAVNSNTIRDLQTEADLAAGNGKART